ncbi:MAG: CYTH domain-containing protein [Magnetococcales bacterium]|nr:CYTH domain-containing protein [Magnetococcales bacterium]
MAIEIERRFLVTGDEWRDGATSIRVIQGFLSTDKDRVVRVRIAGERGTLTIKGRTRDNRKHEFEYAIPHDDALDMLGRLCFRPLIEKQRFTLVHEGMLWVVDEFAGENQGLVLAEIELNAIDQVFPFPPWLGAEISSDPRYFNANLTIHPFCRWERK